MYARHLTILGKIKDIKIIYSQTKGLVIPAVEEKFSIEMLK